MHDDDRRFLRHLFEVIEFDARNSHEDPYIGTEDYLEAIREHVALGQRILDGEPSPWRGNVPEDYLTCMEHIGSDPEGFARAVAAAPIVKLP